jgi:hypothetical protein
VDGLLPVIALLSSLTAVNFHLVSVSTAAFEQFCIAVAPCLQVLLFESARVDNEVDLLTHVGLLHELRVLVVDDPPPLPALLQLHRLVYLHVDRRPNGYEHGLAFAATLRHLSMSHALHSLSLGNAGIFSIASVIELLLATESHMELRAADAALVDWTQPIRLTDLSCASRLNEDLLQRCAAIPTLTRLQTSCWGEGHWPPNVIRPPPPPLTMFAPLQQLRLQLDDGSLLPYVAQCNQLRVLQICSHRTYISGESLCTIVAANAATLEEVRLTIWVFTGAAAAANWSAFARCARLRVFELPMDGQSPHLFVALSKAPAFQSLELALTTQLSQSRLLPALLPSALSSSSWCSVRLFLPAASKAAAPPSTADLTAMLSPASLTFQPPSDAALRRLRVFVCCTSQSTEHCFVLRKSSGGGLLKWQCEY